MIDDPEYMTALDAIDFSGPVLSMRPDAVRQRRWRAANRDRQRIRYVVSFHNRKAARNGGGRVELEQWLQLLAEFDFCCARCGDDSMLLTMDHIQPKSKGGKHLISNLQPLCWPCHRAKGMQAIRFSGRWISETVFHMRREEL